VFPAKSRYPIHCYVLADVSVLLSLTLPSENPVLKTGVVFMSVIIGIAMVSVFAVYRWTATSMTMLSN
jgi:hypothetical protein